MSQLKVHGLEIGLHRWLPRFGPRGPEEGAPVLCLASTGMSGLQWRRLAKTLARQGHRVLAPDLIGYGETATWPGPGPFETRHDVDVAAAALDLLDAPVHLVGHSYGGRVGLALGLRDPAKLCSLALFEPTCFGVLRSMGDRPGLGELHAYDADGRFLDDEFGGTEAWVERFVDYWSGPGTWAGAFSAEERERWLRSSRKMFEEVRETALDEVPHSAYVEALGHLPTLLLSGSASTLAGRRCCEVLAEVMPRARHEELEGEGHMAPLLAAAEVAARIADHIGAVEGAVEGEGGPELEVDS